jgi:hypothetical protein
MKFVSALLLPTCTCSGPVVALVGTTVVSAFKVAVLTGASTPLNVTMLPVASG